MEASDQRIPPPPMPQAASLDAQRVVEDDSLHGTLPGATRSPQMGPVRNVLERREGDEFGTSNLGSPNAQEPLPPSDFDMLQELMIESSAPTPTNRRSPVDGSIQASPGFNEERVAVLRGRSSFRRGVSNRDDSWAQDSDVSSTDTRMSSYDGNYFTRAVQRLAETTHTREHTFESLPLEILRHVCDSYISVRYHMSLRLVNRKLNVLVMSNCCFWQRKVPNYRDVDHEEAKTCLLLRPRRTTVRDVSEVMVSLNGAPSLSATPANSRPGSVSNSRANSPVELSLHSPRVSIAATQQAPSIVYCFNGCAYQVWRMMMIEDKARKFRKSQRHELRAIAADTFASLLFPTAGSNAISFFLACTLFGLLITEISLLFYSNSTYTYREYLPYWLALVVTLPLGAMYMYESSPQRRILSLMTYISIVVSSVLLFLFKGDFVEVDVPWSVCLAPFFIAVCISGALESIALVNRSLQISEKLVPIRDIFVNQKKRHVPMTPLQFLWLNAGLSVGIIVFLIFGLGLFMLENDGVIAKATASFREVNVTNTTIFQNQTSLLNHSTLLEVETYYNATVGEWEDDMPVYFSGLLWFFGWCLGIAKVGCVILAYYSKHLRKYADCSFIVIGHAVLFFFLAVVSLLLMAPVSPVDTASPALPDDKDSFTMLHVILASKSRRLALYTAGLATMIVYFIISFVNTLSSKEKYYKTSLRTKYLPYFDSNNDGADSGN